MGIWEMFDKWCLPSGSVGKQGAIITDDEFDKLYNDVVKTMKVTGRPVGDSVKTYWVSCPIELEAALWQMVDEEHVEFILSQDFETLITYNKNGDPVGLIRFSEDGDWIDIYTLFMSFDYCRYWAVKEQLGAVVNMANGKRVRMYVPDSLPPEVQRAYYDCGFEVMASGSWGSRWVKPVRNLSE